MLGQQLRGEQSCSLTPREVEVLRLIATGKSSKQVAYELGMSFRTAVSHRYRIFQKLGVTKAAELVIRAAQMGLVDLYAKPQPALPQWISSMQEENTAERTKLAALLREAKLLREISAATRQELHAARKDVIAVVKKLVESSQWQKAAS